MDAVAPWLAALALGWSSFSALRRHWRLRIDEALLGAGLLASFEALTVSTVLGLGGLFTRRPVILLTGMIAAAQILSVEFASPPPPRRADAFRRATWPLWPAAAFVFAVVAARVLLAAAIPPESWDGLTYHMPILWRWVQQGSFDLAGWSGPQRWFPWNGELLPAWLAVLGGGSLGPAKVAQTLALPMLAAAGASLGRRLAGRAWSAACALAFAAVPIAVIHAGIPYVDGFQAAFWLGAAAFAVAWDKSGRRVHLLLCALAFGLTLGTKSTIYFLAPLGLPILAALVFRSDRRMPFLRALPWCVLLALAAGGYTYVRNWIEVGNPIYPYALKLGGVKVFDGPSEPGQLLVTVENWFVSSRWDWLTYPFHETMKGDLGYTTENGFGPLFAAGWLLLPWSAFLAWRRRDRAALSFLALVPATALFFFTLHPTREPRYVVFLAGVPIAGLAIALRGLRGRARVLALGLWGLGAAWGALGVLDFIGRDAGLAYAWRELRAHGRIDQRSYYRAQYGSLGQAWEFLDARLKPGDVVAVNYGELVLPWAGIPPRAKLFVIGHKPNDLPQTLWGTTSAEWLGLLNEIDANYFAVWAPAWYTDVGETELATIAAHPEKFASIGVWTSPGFGRVELFELKR
jgi:hypothetical protein